jgi:uncharacterized protein YecE (DUF72 family)
MAIHIGCTGWSYKDWYRNEFYDRKEEEGFKEKYRGLDRIEQPVYTLWKYSQIYDITEVNSFNYTITSEEPKDVPEKAKWWYDKQIKSWGDYQKGKASEDPYFMFRGIYFNASRWIISTPKDFIFTSKVPGMITHAKCLQDCEEETRLFLKGIEPIKDKMKCLLYLFPSYFTKNEFFGVFKDYFTKLPKGHNYVVEFRAADWRDEEVYNFLNKKKITLAMSEVTNPGVTTVKEDKAITDLSYIRIIGKHNVFTSFEKMNKVAQLHETLSYWAKIIKKANNVMCLINNNFAGNAPETANLFMKEYLGIKPKEWKKDSSLSRFF